MQMILLLAALAALLGLAALGYEIRRKNMHIWLWSHITHGPGKADPKEPVHILFAFCDHYEPQWGRAEYEQEKERVDRWCRDYPRLADKHRDADGRRPRHSFFYPSEEYREDHLDKLVKLCAGGYGEIEIHLHHDNDTADGLRKNVQDFLDILDKRHGAIVRHPNTGQRQFAFIHGNWTLDNSGKNGRWCGVNNELAVLSELGCYADFTLPSAPSETQTSKINSIYYATGEDGKCKSHNRGIDVEAGRKGGGDLMIIQGPLCLNWKNRKFGIFPRIENADIRRSYPPSPERVDLWVRCGIHVKKQPQWRFIKVHTHGTQEGDIDTLLGKPVDEMFDYLESRYNDGKRYILHYVTAREMYNIILAAEAGEKGDPARFRDYLLPPPPLAVTESETTQVHQMKSKG